MRAGGKGRGAGTRLEHRSGCCESQGLRDKEDGSLGSVDSGLAPALSTADRETK